jgi:hypothetical protein
MRVRTRCAVAACRNFRGMIAVKAAHDTLTPAACIERA